MTRNEFKTAAASMAKRNGWTLDITEEGRTVCAWFSEPHQQDKPGAPQGADTAQAHMVDDEAPVGLELEPAPAGLKDVTRDTNKRNAERDDERSHVIFKIADGRDYAREEPPRNVRTYQAVQSWIGAQRIPAEVAAFAVEWW